MTIVSSFGPVCPVCHSPLTHGVATWTCAACPRDYPTVGHVPDLTLGLRFDDAPASDVCANEARTGRFLADSYLHPLFQRTFPDRPAASLRILSVGCGVGSDVEALNAHGYDAWGLDAGNRSTAWYGRRDQDRYMLANALRLPFPDASFDVVVAGCVLPHIGVEGDTYTTEADCEAKRDRAVRELVRVVRPKGYLVLSSPNRLCPVDLFHRNGRLSHLPRLHSWSEAFLLSFGDYQRLMQRAGCRRLQLLPIRRYWGFFTSSSYGFGRLVQLPVRLYFEMLSWTFMRWLLPSPLNPWLVVLVQK